MSLYPKHKTRLLSVLTSHHEFIDVSGTASRPVHPVSPLQQMVDLRELHPGYGDIPYVASSHSNTPKAVQNTPGIVRQWSIQDSIVYIKLKQILPL